MKKRLYGVSAGVLIGVMLTSGAVFAKQATEKISVIYDNITILIDGKEYQPTNAKGENYKILKINASVPNVDGYGTRVGIVEARLAKK